MPIIKSIVTRPGTPGAAGEDTVARAGVATNAADIADRARKGRIEALDYGDLSADTADAAANVATLQAAATAAGALSADVVVPGMSIPINDEVVFPAHVGLVGAGREYTTFLATHADAKLTFDEPSESVIAEWSFDGADLAAHAVQVKGAANAVSMRNVRVYDAIRGVSFHNTQNAIIDKLVVDDCVQHLGILDGCGSLVFNALGIANFAGVATTEYAIWMGYEGVESSGYAQPTAITFIAPMIECVIDASVGDALVLIDGCERTTFVNPNFVNSSTAPMVNLRVVSPASYSTVSMLTSSILGDPATSVGVKIAGQSSVTFDGKCTITGALNGIILDGTGSRVQGDLPEMNNVGTAYTYQNSANWFQNTIQTRSNPVLIDAQDNDLPVIRVVRPAGSGPVLEALASGQLKFGSSFSGSTDTNLYRDGGANRLKSDGQITAAMGLTTKTVAGAATDGDVASADPGTIVFDDTNDRLYVKCTGGWKYVTLT